MKKILFICEGEVAEPLFVKQLKKIFLSNEEDNFEIYSYCQNIYDLYKILKDDAYLDICSILKEKAKQEKNDDNYKIFSKHFSEIYLFFDFEFQEPQFAVEKVKEMQAFFDDETGNGKLYINYPMFESLRHFTSLPDEQYLNYVVDKDMCLNDGYKRMVKKLAQQNRFSLSEITYEQYSIIAFQNIKKYSKILNKQIDDYDSYKEYFSLDKLLKYQVAKYNKDNSIYVINTSVLWPLNYFKAIRAEKIYRSFLKNCENFIQNFANVN